MKAPSPKANFLFGHVLAFGRDPFGFPVAAAREHGDVVLMKFPGLPTWLLAHPDDVEYVLVKAHNKFVKDKITRSLSDLLGKGLLVSEGDFWKRQRRLAQPAFHHQHVRGYAEVMIDAAGRAAESWRAGEVIDVQDQMMRVTLGIVAKTLFGAEMGDDAATIGEALDVLLDHFLGFFNTGLRWPSVLPTPGNLRARRAVKRIDEVLYRIIAERHQSKSPRADLLQLLLDARDEDGSRMTDQQLRDETVTLVLAGHETTALVLTYAFHLLARHPEARARLEAELDTVVGDRAPGFDDLPKLRFVENVITETMRLYPPAWAIGREAREPVEIRGVTIPKGGQIFIMPWLNHRDPRFFDAPEEFRPERWENDLHKRIPKFAYFPFGGGPRICIGNAFAKMEAALVLASLAQKWRLALTDEKPLEFIPTVTLRPKHPPHMRVEPRDQG